MVPCCLVVVGFRWSCRAFQDSRAPHASWQRLNLEERTWSCFGPRRGIDTGRHDDDRIQDNRVDLQPRVGNCKRLPKEIEGGKKRLRGAIKIPENGKKWQVVKLRSPRQNCSPMLAPDVDVGRLPLSPPRQLRPVIGQPLWSAEQPPLCGPTGPQATRTAPKSLGSHSPTVPCTCAWMDPRLIFSLHPSPKWTAWDHHRRRHHLEACQARPHSPQI